MVEKNSCVSIYPDNRLLEQALGKLQRVNFDLRQVSVVGKGCQVQELPIGFCQTGERVCFYGSQSSFWEGLWVLLTDAACLWVPGSGVLAAAGHIVPLIVHGLQNSEVDTGFSIPGAALYGIGIPSHSIDEYEQAVNAENYLLLVSGDRREVERACDILHCEAQQVTVHRA